MECFRLLKQGLFGRSLTEVGRCLPDWLFRFNRGYLIHTPEPVLRTRPNRYFVVDEASAEDLRGVAFLTGMPPGRLRERLDAGDTAFVTRVATCECRVVTSQLAHRGPVYVRGLGTLLELGPDDVYLYWAISDPQVRLTGAFSNAFNVACRRLRDAGVTGFYALVQEGNATAIRFHERIGFKLVGFTTYVKILGLRITWLRDLSDGSGACPCPRWRISFREPATADVV